ncbi:hypothetical protein EV426DRAFT_576537 [Tirmania nivea]|nr:hypothetical protein EV426DRAFT_576537 [Tirmania nivea]
MPPARPEEKASYLPALPQSLTPRVFSTRVVTQLQHSPLHLPFPAPRARPQDFKPSPFLPFSLSLLTLSSHASFFPNRSPAAPATAHLTRSSSRISEAQNCNGLTALRHFIPNQKLLVFKDRYQSPGPGFKLRMLAFRTLREACYGQEFSLANGSICKLYGAYDSTERCVESGDAEVASGGSNITISVPFQSNPASKSDKKIVGSVGSKAIFAKKHTIQYPTG